MRVYNPQAGMSLLPGLRRSLDAVRTRRGFSVASYVSRKCMLLNDYLKKSALTGLVIGVSGGIDSAVVLGLAHEAQKKPKSPIKRIIACILPIFSADGATHQNDAVERATNAAHAFGNTPTVIDLTQAHASMRAVADAGLHLDGNGWASGQLVSYIRTPALYYAASLLTASGVPALVLGTTNRDEGSYLGYFGKASDGMVDLQLISDIHKSEVRTVAGFLGVPEDILAATPTGDMYDGRSDEEVFGAPYDFVEFFLAYRALPEKLRTSVKSDWTRAEKKQFSELSARLEHLHDYNAHKYAVGNPSVHLDVYHRPVPGGWS